MSTKKEICKSIVDLLKTLPKERMNHYACFKDVQISRFSSPEIESVSEKDLKLQYIALRDLVNDKYRNYYPLDKKITEPKGNPQYYTRLMAEIRGEKKETLWSALRTVIFGK